MKKFISVCGACSASVLDELERNCNPTATGDDCARFDIEELEFFLNDETPSAECVAVIEDAIRECVNLGCSEVYLYKG